MPRIDSNQFYTSAINKYGETPKGVHWNSKKSQEIRFKTLLNLLPSKIDSLADAGCGFGDLFFYLQKNNYKIDNYIGVDSHQSMLEIAKRKTKQNITLANIITDPIPKAEYYLCSGAMNILTLFETHLFIRKCFYASQKGFVFNILYGEKQSDTYNYLTKEQILKIAADINVSRIELREDYLENDITVGLFHV